MKLVRIPFVSRLIFCIYEENDPWRFSKEKVTRSVLTVLRIMSEESRFVIVEPFNEFCYLAVQLGGPDFDGMYKSFFSSGRISLLHHEPVITA
jgi:hypothetical protein